MLNYPKAILFDMDGVVIDSHAVSHELLLKTVRQYVPSMTSSELSKFGGLSFRLFWEKIKTDYGLDADLETLNNSYDEQKEIDLYFEIDLIPGARDLLASARIAGLKTALVTSASRKRMESVLDIFNIRQRFDATVCDEDVFASKPDPQIYLTAAEKLRVNPTDCIAIEDSRSGVLAAKNAGMRCIGFKYSKHTIEDLSMADTIVSAFSEIDVGRIFERGK